MQIVFLIKPFSIHMYSYVKNAYELLGTQDISSIENENNTDYENRVVYVCKDICQDFVNTDIYKKNIKNIKVVLTNPWCIYEIMNLEKKLDKPQKINQKFIDQLIVHKESDQISILKNSIFNVALNGYNVLKVQDQTASTIHLQYLSIYTSSNFLSRLKNTLDTIFHLHDVEVDSIYSFINEYHTDEKSFNQLKIIIEDQGLDLSYVYQNKNIATLFIRTGYLHIMDKIKELLHIDDTILDKILKSKSLNMPADKTKMTYDKNLSNIWLDLDEETRVKIDKTLDQELENIKTQIRDFVDNIGSDLIQKDVNINIYCMNQNVLSTALILAGSIKNDDYILNKLLTNESNIFTKKIF
ncbi:hypothetical protein H7Y21_00500 [Arenimonas sp.]|nr:hypothetical protein [Candidatus Parcubacteria bacterium]